jgi:hypothetical protein
MISNLLKLKKRNQLEIEVPQKNIIKNIVIIPHLPPPPILLNHVHKKRKNHPIIILNIINPKNTMIEDENIKINLCISLFFLYDIIQLKNNISKHYIIRLFSSS